MSSLRDWARRLKRDVVMIWFARRHPDTPLLAKILCVVAVLYALSPIDLVPDFIPVLGYVDDVLLLPALIWLVIRMLPARVVQECRGQAHEWMEKEGAKPKSRLGAAIIIAIWIVLGTLCWRWLAP